MKKLFLYLNLFFVVGCAQTDLSDRNDIAIIDTRGVDESVFKKNYSECSDFAKDIDLTERTLKQGAVAGATGAAVGAIIVDSDAAKKFGDYLVVALNSDKWLEEKKGKAFMPFEERNFLDGLNPRPAWWNKAWGKKQ